MLRSSLCRRGSGDKGLLSGATSWVQCECERVLESLYSSRPQLEYTSMHTERACRHKVEQGETGSQSWQLNRLVLYRPTGQAAKCLTCAAQASAADALTA